MREAEDEQDRREVEQQQVLDHVHGEELLAEAVDGRDQRDDEHERAPARKHEPAASRRSARGPASRRAAPPAPHVDGPTISATSAIDAGLEGPRVRPGTAGEAHAARAFVARARASP